MRKIRQTDEITFRRQLRWNLAAAEVTFRAARLWMLLSKANFNPNQPRVPRGNPDGGQWTDEDGEDPDFRLLFVSHDPGGPDTPPDIPEEKPPTIRERNRIAVAVARYLRSVNTGLRAAEIAVWVIDHAGNRIAAFLDEPKTLEELQRAVQEPRFGYDVHHIVEQSHARQNGFSEAMINAPENLVRISTYRHWEITGWFQTPNEDYDGLSPREYLRDKDWVERTRVGLDALIEHGVLKP